MIAVKLIQVQNKSKKTDNDNVCTSAAQIEYKRSGANNKEIK